MRFRRCSGIRACIGKSKTSYVRTRVYKSRALSIGIWEGPTFLTRFRVCVGKLNRIKDSVFPLIGLLDDIARNPEELSRRYYESINPHAYGPDICQIESGGRASLAEAGITESSQLKKLINRDDFAKYADASGKHVCPRMVKVDRDKLKSALEACEAFADKRIAHRDNEESDVVPKIRGT